jgi:predicted DCC family thiol-disulfide oxidoreductase YuxK
VRVIDSLGGVLLVFDGDCGFCQLCVDAGRKALPYMPLVKAWQFLDLDAVGITREQAAAAVQLVGPNGLHASGARAVALILAVQPHLGWRTAGRAMLVPPISWLACAAYTVIARYRHRLPGGGPGQICGTAQPDRRQPAPHQQG